MFDFEKPKIEISQISEDKKYGREESIILRKELPSVVP